MLEKVRNYTEVFAKMLYRRLCETAGLTKNAGEIWHTVLQNHAPIWRIKQKTAFAQRKTSLITLINE